jgi:pyrroline-5-carboxylate reductase
MKIAVLGVGVMGSAFARHFAKKHSVVLCSLDKARTEVLAKEIGAHNEEKPDRAVHEADIIFLAVKPKDLSAIAKEISVPKDKIIISILAGTSLSMLKAHFPTASIVRSMPNLALTCGQGVMGLVEDPHLSAQAKKTVAHLLEGIGLVLWMTENKLEALTALSGSGIGFVLVMIEAMIDGGVNLGFTSEESRDIVLKTMEGAVALMRDTGKHPAELKLQIASPGGTTIAGLQVMEEEGVRAGIVHTLMACYEKALNMMK